MTFNKEALNTFLRFATSPEALWSANFRDLSSAITRMATLSHGGRITTEVVVEEIARLRKMWQGIETDTDESLIESVVGVDKLRNLDRFEKTQLADVLHVCSSSKNLSDAGRKLFNVSRQNKKHFNDSDRLRKYLQKYGITWDQFA